MPIFKFVLIILMNVEKLEESADQAFNGLIAGMVIFSWQT